MQRLTTRTSLDSLGAGTADKVRQVELDYNVSKLKLEEDEQKFIHEAAVAEADFKVKELELSIARKTLVEARNEIGAQVAQGEKVAVVSDLSHFKIEGEIADTYGDRIAAGSRAVVKIGNEKLPGIVSDLTPLSKNGVISFSVRLDKDNHRRLRSGLKTDVYILTAVKDSVLRIQNGSYYVCPGKYELFVRQGNELVRREVQLGESNYEQVEVLSGLQLGEAVVISDMGDYKNKRKIKLD